MSVRFLIFLGALCGVIRELDAQQTETLVTRNFDLSYLTGLDNSIPLRPDLPLLRAYAELSNPAEPERKERSFEGDRIIELIRISIAPESWETNPNFRLHFDSGNLMVRQTEARVKAIAVFLEYLEAATLGDAKAEVYSLAASALPAGAIGVLAPAAVQSLMEGSSLRAVGQMRLTPGIVARLRSGNRQGFVGDYDVEVAQETEAADPTICVVDVGIDLRVCFNLTPGGEIVAQVGATLSSLESLRGIDTGSSVVGRLQLPIVDSMLVVASGRLKPGGGLLLGLTQGGEDRLLLVRITAAAPPKPLEQTAIISCAPTRLLSEGLELLLLGSPRRSGFEPRLGQAPEYAEPYPILSADTLIERVRESVEPENWEGDQRQIMLTSGFLFVRAPESIIEQVTTVADTLCVQRSRTISLEVRAGRLDAEKFQQAARGTADPAVLAGLLDARGSLSAVVGDSFRLIAGREQAFVKDHDIEVAQDASIGDPVISTIFSGLAFQGRFSVKSIGTPVFEGEVVVHDLNGEIPNFLGGAEDIGFVEQPSVGMTHARITVPLPAGKWCLAHLVARPGHGDGLAVLFRTVE